MVRLIRIAGALAILCVSAALFSAGCTKKFPTQPIGPAPNTPTPVPTSAFAPLGSSQTPGASEVSTPTITPTSPAPTTCGFAPVTIGPRSAFQDVCVIQSDADWMAYKSCGDLSACPPPVDWNTQMILAASYEYSEICACDIQSVQFESVCLYADRLEVRYRTIRPGCVPVTFNPCEGGFPGFPSVICLQAFHWAFAAVAVDKTALPVVWIDESDAIVSPGLVPPSDPVSFTTWVATVLPCVTLATPDTPEPTGTPTPSPTGTITPEQQAVTCLLGDEAISLPGSIGNPGYVILSTETPTFTPTSVPWDSQGVIRNDADWASYCAMVSLDPADNPPPVDFTSKMIIFWGHINYSCPIIRSIQNVCLFDDRWEVTEIAQGDYCAACPMWYVTPLTLFDGYVVDQSSLPVVWKFDDQTTNCFGQ